MTEHQKHQSNSPLSVNRVLENIIKSSGLITQNISAKKRAVSLMQHNDENPCRCGFFSTLGSVVYAVAVALWVVPEC